jgi:alginate O-acetyltransferase complex protein AlgJ
MNPASLPDKIRQGKLWLLSLLFLALICLPTLDWIFHLDHAPMANEKRLLTKFPEFRGLAQLQEFITGLEGYFNDHFGFRKRLVRTYNGWRRQWFHGAPHNNVIVGRDGWLFSIADRMLDEYFGQMQFSEPDLDAWQRLLEKRRDWAARRGIKYLFVIAPDKHSIYPEYLPEWIAVAKSRKPDKTEQFMAHMRTRSTVEVLNLRQPLRDAKPLGVSYLKTDTHWNFLGGFIACQAVVRALARQVPQLKPLPLEAFERKVEIRPAGDLGGILDNSEAKETQMITLAPRPPLHGLQSEAVPSRLPGKWYKGGEPVVTRSESGQGKVIVFRDSFSGGFQPFLGFHFKEVLYIWQYNWDAAFLEREKPDIVVDEMLERFFNLADPNELARKDQLSATDASRAAR